MVAKLSPLLNFLLRKLVSMVRSLDFLSAEAPGQDPFSRQPESKTSRIPSKHGGFDSWAGTHDCFWCFDVKTSAWKSQDGHYAHPDARP
jgi:hypothetical protein